MTDHELSELVSSINNRNSKSKYFRLYAVYVSMLKTFSIFGEEKETLKSATYSDEILTIETKDIVEVQHILDYILTHSDAPIAYRSKDGNIKRLRNASDFVF